MTPKFDFTPYHKAATKNFKLLESSNLDCSGALYNDSITQYSSEFKGIDQLEKVMQHHPRWTAMKLQLNNGVRFDAATKSKKT